MNTLRKWAHNLRHPTALMLLVAICALVGGIVLEIPNLVNGGALALPIALLAGVVNSGGNDPDGTQYGKTASALLGWWGATPVVQPSGSAQAALTTGADYEHWFFYTPLADIADGDLLTSFVPGFAGTLVAFDAWVQKAATTAAKASTLNLEIDTTNVTGGSLALTSANCTPKGVKVAGTAITAANTFTSTQAISIEAASTTAFVEGAIWMDITYTRTTLPGLVTAIRSALVTIGLIKGSA